ncbi:MAG: ATP-binding protein [Herpetosiphonaceae bacterium]|nr:ATP-binding protein [Herpetosiphonaceae bacterium]
MSSYDAWQASNEAYLGAALHWLRLRLSSLIPLERHETSGAEAESDAELVHAATAVANFETVEPTPALLFLSQRLGLSPFERELLLLLAAIELDTRVAGLCARAQDDPHRSYPTFALALTLFDDPAWEVLSPERPLRYWRLLEINQPTGQPLTQSPLRIDERILNYLKGLNYLDDRLAPLILPIEPIKLALPASHQTAVEALGRAMQSPTKTQRQPIVQLVGSDGPSKQHIASAVAEGLGLHLLRLPSGLLPAHASDLETLTRLWQRESMLLPLALYLDATELDRGASEAQLPLNRFLQRADGIIFLDVRDSWPGLDRSTITLDIAKPTPVEQQVAWSALLGDDDAPALLASQFNISLATMEHADQLARTIPTNTNGHLPQHLWDACLASTRPKLDLLAQRLEPKATWETMVLPREETALLRQVADQVGQRSKVYDSWGFRRRMNRGLGISALFAGESGTGKTMAAEVLANELRLNLYRIDLSSVVSKYIGETEKNLRRLFDAAEDGGAILFFDEADALFGKRSEVKDSHDRYANIEINYLLQRIEAYQGLAILATNMKGALDTAFMRRLRFVVTFPFPGQAERKLMWQKAFPPETPTEALDFDRLARLTVTGGNIHNIALNAAFMAAKAMPSVVTMPLVLQAARIEFRKLERPMNEADFRWQDPARVAA